MKLALLDVFYGDTYSCILIFRRLIIRIACDMALLFNYTVVSVGDDSAVVSIHAISPVIGKVETCTWGHGGC